MIEKLSRGRRNLALGVLGLLVLWFAWSIRSVLNPVILGYLCAFILTPVVVWVERRGFSRLTAVNLTFAAGFLGAGLVVLVMSVQVLGLVNEVREGAPLAAAAQVAPTPPGGPKAMADGPALDAQASPLKRTFRQRLERRLENFRTDMARWGLDGFVPASKDILDQLDKHQSTLFGAAGSGVRLVFAFLGRLLGLAGMFLLLPLYAYYFLFVQKDLHHFIESCLPKAQRERVMRVGGEIGEVVASFFRGRLGVSLIKGLLISLGLSLFGVEYAFLLGMTSGLLSVIPFVGPFLGFLITFAIDVPMHIDPLLWGIQHNALASLVRTGIVFGVAELVEGYVLVPRILGDSLGLHPLVVFVALLAGGAALGTLGILIALPLTAVLVILFKEFVQPALHEFAEE